MQRSVGRWVFVFGATAVAVAALAVVSMARRPELWPLAVLLGISGVAVAYLVLRTMQLWLTLRRLNAAGGAEVVIHARRTGGRGIVRRGFIIGGTGDGILVAEASLRTRAGAKHRIPYSRLQTFAVKKTETGRNESLELEALNLHLTLTAAPPHELHQLVTQVGLRGQAVRSQSPR